MQVPNSSNATNLLATPDSDGPEEVTEISGESEEKTLEDKALADAESTHVLIAVRDLGPGPLQAKRVPQSDIASHGVEAFRLHSCTDESQGSGEIREG